MARQKTETGYPKCPLCGEPMPVEYGCNFEQFTERAYWNIDFKSRMKFCGKCSSSLLDYVHKWYKERNKTNEYDKFKI